MAAFLHLLAVLCIMQINAIDATVLVNLPGLGRVRGLLKTVLPGREVQVFQGIPFAQPPMGHLRFKSPMAVRPWNGTLNATKTNVYCPQSGYFNNITLFGNEDCLYLNVYTPNVAISELLPVMVWIHGGGYIIGSGSQYDGALFAAKYNVVVVIINYRLGVLGFFNIPGTTTKGNYGMMDQIAALNWTRKYIDSLRGDPNKVTIFGESAGAGSVTLLQLSPLAKGLFSRVIAQSGSPTCHWAIDEVTTTNYSKEFGAKLGCDNIATMTECLRGKTWQEIVQQQGDPNAVHPLIKPTVDGIVFEKLPYHQAEMDRLPASSVELLIGFNKDEGTMFVPALPSWNRSIFDKMTSDALKWRYKSATNVVTDAVSYNYPHYDKATDNLKFSLGYSDFFSEYFMFACITNFASAWAKNGANTYFYEFTYLPKYRRVPSWLVSHGIDLDFVFGKPFYAKDDAFYKGFYLSNYTNDDKLVSEKMMTMWTNFAKTGNPESSWPKYNSTTKHYLKIDLKTEVMSNVKPKCLEFWNKFIPRLINITSQKYSKTTQQPVTSRKICNDGTTLEISIKILLIGLSGFIAFTFHF